MLAEDPDFRGQLRRIAQHLLNDRSWLDDLVQEGLIHLWRIESTQPRQTPSWYLQSCRFHLQHFLRSDRSLDGPSRAASRTICPTDGEADDNLCGRRSEDTVVSDASAHELLDLLGTRLSKQENEILRGLIDGLTTRALADRFGVSPSCIVNRRRRFAVLARKLGLEARPAKGDRLPN